ncbi:Uncharacterised protein [Vibrio cholerae]|nr:Uncharacterised protein [Vibrio cholerae]CSD20576.1 Uncharacterised protein [Vibrio cholerae]CSI46482.1 Uncharacterised protein [Vibrio cholerae]CSI86232.1 Uncharacterised protein [Vibrio cholerae]
MFTVFSRFIENIANPSQCDKSVLKILPNLCQSQNGLSHMACEHIEGH